MASPFRIFRKYMKVLLVVFGVLMMFVFVIGDQLQGYLSGVPRGAGDPKFDPNAVAVKWDGGSLTNVQLNELTTRRRIAKAFVMNLMMEGMRDAYLAGVEPAPLRVEPVFQQNTPEKAQDGVERSVVQTRLFADAARKAGMSISDEAIVQYLDELGGNKVTRDQMRALLKNMSAGGSRVSIDYIIAALREELLARNYIASHQFAWETITPQQRWEDWLTVNDRVVIEAAALPAESFITEVANPTDAEIQKFYDEYKDRVSMPEAIGQLELPSPTPGFAIPRKVDAQFIEASYDEYLTKLETEVTEEEIAKYYEERKDLFIKADMGLLDSTDAAPADGATGEDATTDATATPPAESTPAEPATETAPATEEEKGAETTEAPATETPAGEQPATETPATSEAAPAEETESAPKEGDQSSQQAPQRSVFRLANFQEEKAGEEGTSTAENPVAETPAAEAPATETTAAEQPASPPAEEPAAPAADGPATTEEAPAASEAPATDAGPIGPQPPAASAESPTKPVEYESLDQVRDLIRRELAERRTADKLKELMTGIQEQLDVEFSAYLLSDAARAKPPAGLANLAPVAEKHGLKHGATGPVSMIQLRDLPVGKSGNPATGYPVWYTLFEDASAQLYQPLSTIDLDGNRFIVVKTADTPGRVPKLDEVKQEVIQAWKMQKASELAKKRAEELAKEANAAGVPLAQFFANQQPVREVVRTDPFSHYTGGDVSLIGAQRQQQPFRLSQPEGIVAAGPVFLDDVFKLKQGQVGAIMNNDNSIAYVVRLAEHQESPEELRTAFLSEANTWPGVRLMANAHARDAAAQLVNNLTNGADLKWERTPDFIERDEPQSEDEAAKEEEKQSDAG